MQQHLNQKGTTTIFHTFGNGSNDGSVYANKSFHIVYYVLNHDFANKMKTIIGILYNKFDKDKMYFSCIMPLKEQFSIPYLLKNIIFKPRYDSYMMKKILFEENKQVMEYADKILMDKVKL